MPEENKDAALGTPIEGIPLRSMAFYAKITGLQQEVVVTQAYGNALDHPVEAVYVFPLPSEAAVLGVEMQIGARRIVSELRRREDAAREYGQARDAGHHAALLEQERPNIFTMSVAGIEPGEAISVTVRYLAPIAWQDGGGRLSIPLVVAPRFIPGAPADKPQGAGWAPDTDVVPDASRITPKIAEQVPYVASAEIALDAGFPCHVESYSHGAMFAACDLASGEARVFKLENLRPDRDIIIAYKTASPLPTVKVDAAAFSPADGSAAEQFILLQLTAGAGQESADPLDVVFLLDGSGSMNGPKMVGLKRVVDKALDRLAAFSRTVRVAVASFGNNDIRDCEDTIVHVGLSTIGEAHRKAVKELQARGGTYAGAALTKVMGLFEKKGLLERVGLSKKGEDHERCIILVSDGQTEDRHFTEVGGVRVHAIGIDTAVNDEFLLDVARRTGGGTRWFRPGEDFDAAAAGVVALASGPVVREVVLRGLPEDAVVTGLADLYASQPATIAIRFAGNACGFKVLGSSPDGKAYEWDIAVPESSPSSTVSQIWARMRLKEAEGEDQVELSLRYGIICQATAFVAVSLKDEPGQAPERVDIPVLLPETWNYDAVFGNVSAAFCGFVGSGGAGPVFARTAGFGFAPFPDVSGLDGHGLMSLEASPPLPDPLPNLTTLDPTEASQDVLSDGFPWDKMAPVSVGTAPVPAAARPKLLEEAKAFLRMLESGSSISTAEWLAFTNTIASETYLLWSDLDRADLYETIIRIRPYGFIVEIPKALEAEPADAGARRSWQRARQALGFATL